MESTQPVARGKRESNLVEVQCQVPNGVSQTDRTMSVPLRKQVPEESSKLGVVVRYCRLFGVWFQI